MKEKRKKNNNNNKKKNTEKNKGDRSYGERVRAK